MPSAAFSLLRPERRETPAIFSSPHSGSDYPAALLSRSALDELAIRSSDVVYGDVIGCGSFAEVRGWVMVRVRSFKIK